jgi:hypothetical protein
MVALQGRSRKLRPPGLPRKTVERLEVKRMNRPRRILRGLWVRVTQRPQAAPVTHLKVVNLTRQTVLAARMELADRGETRRKGLLGRQGLAPEEGLWIIPCEAVHTFGMKFSIDLVYLDRKNRIRKLRSEVPPWRLSACLTAHSVMEFAAGTIRHTRTEPGDTLEFTPCPPPDDCAACPSSPA